MQRLVSKALEQFAGSGVGIDDDGRLCLPDGLDAPRTHRFIELVMARDYESPKAAMHDLFGRVGVAPRAIEALEELLGDEGHLDWSTIGQSPLKIGSTLPRFLEIPARFRSFLIEGLELILLDSLRAQLQHQRELSWIDLLAAALTTLSTQLGELEHELGVVIPESCQGRHRHFDRFVTAILSDQ